MDERLTPILERLGLREREVVEAIRRSDPSRAVRSTSANVIGRYPSRKMGVTIQFESHKNELAFILELEHNPDVIEYYDQPPRIPLTYRARNGRRLDVQHTPDFFVLATNWIGWVECKTESELNQLVGKQPNRYFKDDAGWRCPPGELHAVGLGFQYRVRSSSEINWIVQRNVAFLEDYLRADIQEIPRVHLDLVGALVQRHPGLALRFVLDLFEEHGIPSDRLYAMIVTDQIFVDLAAVPLSEPNRVRLYPDREAALQCFRDPSEPMPTDFEPNRMLVWDDRPLTILHRGDQTLWLEQADGAIIALSEKELVRLVRTGHIVSPATTQAQPRVDPIRDRLTNVTPSELAEATRRNTALRQTPEELSRRTRARWRARLRKSATELGEGFFGLIPETGKRGNRTRRLPAATIALTERFIKERFENTRQPNLRSVWAKLVVACEAERIDAPSYETFRRIARARPRELQVRARQGARAAYADQPPVWELTLTTPRHGDRPFEIGHLDHTELDLELVCSLTGQNLGRPWLTLLSDAFSRRVLAFRLSFEAPSYRACMAVFRECVRRFQSLPSTLITDAGPEFQSAYYDALLARFEITKKIRPATQSRFGSVCERLFGSTNSRFVHTLAGNTQLTAKNIRLATGVNNPKKQAVWTLERLHEQLTDYLYDAYDTLDHPALGLSPRDAFQKGRANSGTREFRQIRDDLAFRLMTMPTTTKGTGTIISGRGFKVNGIYYWHSFFKGLPARFPPVAVRYDPDDMGHAWALLNRQWLECQSEMYAVFHGRSESEIRIASTEFRKRLSVQSGKARLSAVALAGFLKSTDQAELDLQRLRTLAQKRTAYGIRTTPSSPVSEPVAQTLEEKLVFSIDELEIYGELE